MRAEAVCGASAGPSFQGTSFYIPLTCTEELILMLNHDKLAPLPPFNNTTPEQAFLAKNYHTIRMHDRTGRDLHVISV